MRYIGKKQISLSLSLIILLNLWMIFIIEINVVVLPLLNIILFYAIAAYYWHIYLPKTVSFLLNVQDYEELSDLFDLFRIDPKILLVLKQLTSEEYSGEVYRIPISVEESEREKWEKLDKEKVIKENLVNIWNNSESYFCEKVKFPRENRELVAFLVKHMKNFLTKYERDEGWIYYKKHLPPTHNQAIKQVKNIIR